MRLCALALIAVALAPCGAQAEAEFPNHAIRIVVATPPGSSSDLLARVFSKGLQEQWGQPIVIENRVGASHNIAADFVAKSAPDGYTLLAAPPPALAINQYLFPKLPFDPLAFTPVTVMADIGNVLVVRKDLPAKDLAGLVELAKKRPGELNYGSTGKGSTLQLSAEAFKARAGIDLLHVPYTGVPQVLNELLAGRVDTAFINLIDVYPFIANGSVRALGYGLAKPSPDLPDVPPIADAYPGFASSAWFAVAAPPKTPAAIATKLADAIRASFKQPDAAQALRNMHAAPVLDAPEEAKAFIKADSERWRQVIVSNNIQAE